MATVTGITLTATWKGDAPKDKEGLLCWINTQVEWLFKTSRDPVDHLRAKALCEPGKPITVKDVADAVKKLAARDFGFFGE